RPLRSSLFPYTTLFRSWGVPYFRGDNKHARGLKRIAKLVEMYDPDVAVLEDTSAAGCRRCARVRKFLRAASALFTRRGVRVKVRSEEHTSELQSPCNLV